MNEHTIVVVASPMTDPVRRDEQRTRTAMWTVGPITDGRWQQQAEMIVSHWRHHNSYQCALRAVRKDTTGPVRPITEWAPGDPYTLRFHQRPTPHFNQDSLNQAYASALTDLRDRFQAGDQQIRRFFVAMPDAKLLII
jgi:hypothetical protein